MKKLVVFLVLLTPGSFALGQNTDEISAFIKTDSAVISNWDASGNIWQPGTGQYYEYNDNGRILNVVTKSLSTGSPLTKIEYSYNESGKDTMIISFTWTGAWSVTARTLQFFNPDGKISELLLQKWGTGGWINNRWQKNYEYDTEGKLIRYESSYWRNNAWSLPTIHYVNYNTSGQLEMIISYYPTGNVDSRILYEYDSFGLRTRMYAQSPAVSGWNNMWLIEYSYDFCGHSSLQVRSKGMGNDWIPETKTISYKSFNYDLYDEEMVQICYKGRTLYVPVWRLDFYLRGGTCLGKCLKESPIGPHRTTELKPKSSPITVFPNPASDYLTIRLNTDELIEVRIELLDFSGNKLGSVFSNGQPEVLIHRNNLKSGNYILRITGDSTYSTIVTFR